MSKGALIHLITTWRGVREMAIPAAELRSWSRDELENAWRELQKAGR